jgi:outer membrane protein assembly factor BamB
MDEPVTRRALLAGVGSLATAGVASAGGDGTDVHGSKRRVEDRTTTVSDGTAGADWPSVCLDAANTGYAPDRQAPTAGASVAWSVDTGEWVGAGPVVADGTVFFGSDDQRVYAVDAESGTVRWTRDVAGSPSTPSVIDGTVYVGSFDGNLYALSAADGTVEWTAETNGYDPFGTATTVADGTVYAGRLDSGLYAVSTADGTVEWTYDAGGTVDAAPAVADGRVYLGSDSGRVAALDAAAGTERWTVETDDIVRVGPAVTDGVVYVGGDDGLLRALDAADGTERWTHEFAEGVRASPAVSGDTVYAASQTGVVTALAAADGEQRWTQQVFGTFAPPVVVGDHLYVGSATGTVSALDTATGRVAWTLETDDSVMTAPAPSGGRLFVGSHDGNLYALEADATATTTTEPLPGTATQPPGTGTETRGPGTSAPREGTATSASATTEPAGGADSAVETDQDGKAAATGTPAGGGVGGPDASSSGVPVELLALAAGTLGVGGLGGGYLWFRSTGEADTGDGAATADSADADAAVGQTPSTPDDVAGGVDLGSISLVDDTSTEEDLDDVSILSLVGCDSGGCSEEAAADAGVPDKPPELRVAGLDREWVSEEWPVTPSAPGGPELDVEYDDIEKGKPLGSGGQGDVYRATVDGVGGDFALKELRVTDPLGDREAVDVLAEAETWARLADHAHVVDVTDWGREPLPWILTEYVGGGHLGRRAGTLEFDQTVWTAVGITRAVRHAHRQGVAHFDLKPTNVLFKLVDGWDVPKVADWGLSRRLLTHSGTVEGFSPRYAAPEQVDDAYGDPDERTDVYQLGALCYTLFTGQPPYRGQPASVVRDVVAEQPPAPTEVADVPPAVDEVVHTAMAKEKRDRYESVLYLRDDLTGLVDEG